MFELLIVAGVVVLALALFTFASPLLRRLGGLCVLAATFLSGFFASGRVWVGVVLALAWFFIPWLEILTRVRRLRFPLDRRLAHRHPPSRDRFPALAELTREIESSGFEYVDDTGWDWGEVVQFTRVFYHPERRTQASISLNEQSNAAVAFVALSSRTPGGDTLVTWNYPFAPTMKFAPDLHVNRQASAVSFDELLASHEGFLGERGLRAGELEDPEPDQLADLMQRELREQIDHNLDLGLIVLSGEGTVRYSWRGLFFLWCQFLKDLARFS